MTVRTKAELDAQVASMFPSAGSPRITAEELRDYLLDVNDSVEFPAPAPSGTMFYIGWASPAAGNAQPTITAADFAAATSYQGASVTVPVQGTAGDFLWFARDTYPSHVRFNSAQGRDSIGDFDEQAGVVAYDGADHAVGVGKQRSGGAIGGHDIFFED